MNLARTCAPIPIAPILIAATAFLPLRAEADPALELDGLAEQVARLRSEIESLDARVQDQKDGRRTQLRSLATQRSTLEAELQREEMRAKQIADRIARGDQRAAVEEERRQHLARAVLSAVETSRSTLGGGIPFQKEERAAELDAIAREVEAGTLLPGAALGRLWAWIDGELKLTKESGLHQQVLLLDGAEVLADIARLGMVALYFRAPDDRFGWARREGDGWRWESVELPEERERIQALFTAMEQDVRTGLFELPGAVQGEP